MANPMENVGMTVAGRFHVDSNRIDGDVFREMAPDNVRVDDQGCPYVFEQAERDNEEAYRRGPMESCPVEATGDHGDEI